MQQLKKLIQKNSPPKQQHPVSETNVWVNLNESDLRSQLDKAQDGYPWRKAVVLSQTSQNTTVELLQEKKKCTIPNSTSNNGILPREIITKQALHHMSNLEKMSHLHEPEIVNCLKERFAADLIYSYTGTILLAINPYRNIPGLYALNKFLREEPAASRQQQRPPHIFAMAEKAYDRMRCDRSSQTILVSGESGAGKTESTKFIMQYLATVVEQNHKKTNRNMGDVLLSSNPILESFGNCRTHRNDNSSRFGKFVKIHFSDVTGEITDTSISTYLLEKVRLVHQANGERNFHVFYELLAANHELKNKLCLTDCESYHYTNQSNCFTRKDGESDAENFIKLQNALSVIGLTTSEIDGIFQIIAGLLELGNINFEKQDEGNVSVCSSSIRCQKQSALHFGLESSDLERALTTRRILVRNDVFSVFLSLEESVSSRDTLARYLYDILFSWLVFRINRRLSANGDKKNDCSFIGVLDIFGFENFNYNSFEQLCINFANEKLQDFFNNCVLRDQFKELSEEGVYIDNNRILNISSNDSFECLKIYEDKPRGIFSLLDEECVVPQGSDDGFYRKLKDFWLKKRKSKFRTLACEEVNYIFHIVHFAGAVKYSSKGFCDKNKDQSSLENIYQLVKSSHNLFLKSNLYDTHRNGFDKKKEKNSISKTHRRRSSIGNIPGLGTQFKIQLNELLSVIMNTNAHFVRCFKPNDRNSGKIFDLTRMAGQLESTGVLKAVQIARIGYPVRLSFVSFVNRYQILNSDENQNELNDSMTTNKNQCQFLVLSLIKVYSSSDNCPVVVADNHQNRFYICGSFAISLGKSKIFMEQDTYLFLEEQRSKTLSKCATKLQFSLTRLYKIKKERDRMNREKARRNEQTVGKIRTSVPSHLENATASVSKVFSGASCYSTKNSIHFVILLQCWWRQIQSKAVVKKLVLNREKLHRSISVSEFMEMKRLMEHERQRANKAEEETRAQKVLLKEFWANNGNKKSVCHGAESSGYLQDEKGPPNIATGDSFDVDNEESSTHSICQLLKGINESDVDKVKLYMSKELSSFTDDEGKNLLHLAKDIEIAEILLSYQSMNINHVDLSGLTPLASATIKGNIELVDFLCNKSADLNIAEFNNCLTPLHLAIRKGKMDIVSLFCRPDLLEKIDLNAPDQNGNTALHFLAMSSHVNSSKMIELVLALGADINACNISGRTPLHLVCIYEKNGYQKLECLIRFKVSLNAQANDGKTALHTSVERGNDKAAILLVQHGASMNIADQSGKMVIASHKAILLLPHITAQPILIPKDIVVKCMICANSFNFFNRQYHCRRCGTICCLECSKWSSS